MLVGQPDFCILNQNNIPTTFVEVKCLTCIEEFKRLVKKDINNIYSLNENTEYYMQV